MSSLANVTLVAVAALSLGCDRESHAAEPPPPVASVAAATSEPASSGAPDAAPSPIAPPDAGAPAAATPDAGARRAGDCPEGMARVGRFCIDRWEAHLAVRQASGELAKLPHFERPQEGVAYEACAEAGAFPQAYISRVEAAAACRNAGKRLCSMTEWQRACQGGHGTTYPYGPRKQAKRCNTDKPHLLAARFGADARRWRYDDFNDPSLNQTPGFLAAAGAFDECVGEAGVYDLVGNVHEWVSDSVDQELMDKLAAEDVERNEQPWRPGNGVFMGGFFSTHEQLGPGCKYVTVAHEPTYHDYSTGFRCCANARAPARK